MKTGKSLGRGVYYQLPCLQCTYRGTVCAPGNLPRIPGHQHKGFTMAGFTDCGPVGRAYVVCVRDNVEVYDRVMTLPGRWQGVHPGWYAFEFHNDDVLIGMTPYPDQKTAEAAVGANGYIASVGYVAAKPGCY